MNLEHTNRGYSIKTEKYTILFGGKNAQYSDLTKAHPDFKFKRLKQVHSDKVVKTSHDSADYEVEADAHITAEQNLALCVITADCIPMFLYDSTKNLTAGIHAGWRGVANQIIPKTLDQMVEMGCHPRNITAIIGPHIQKQSFEVGNDVRDQIISTIGQTNAAEKREYWEPISNDKSLVDLNLVAKTQLQEKGVVAENVFSLHIDTVTNELFHSYRRDQANSGRQISFICRNF